MSDFSLRSDSLDVEQIMHEIRARIREKRGVDYTEEEIRELANVKLERFLDPRGVRSDLLEQFRRKRQESGVPWNFTFEDDTLFGSPRPLVRFIRRMLRPFLKLFINVNPVIEALHIQSRLNESEPLHFELIHNLVLETTRLSMEVKNLKMRLESMSSRLDFDERRARALEGVVQYRPGAVPPLQPHVPGESAAEESDRRTRRRRRRGRRRPGDRSDRPAPDQTGGGAAQGEPQRAADRREDDGGAAPRPRADDLDQS